MEVLAALLFSFIAIFALLWFPFAWLACAIFSGIIASEKRYSGVAWFLLGVLFGPLTLLATVGLPSRMVQLNAPQGQSKLEPAFSPRGS